jgi:hypothetical protein
MIQVRLLTFDQAELLKGNQFKPDQYFNPIEDRNGNWTIGNVEAEYCENEQFIWVNELPLIDWIAPIEPELT